MQKISYDPEWVQAHFDDYGVQEWERLAATPSAEVSLHIHTVFLERAIRPGMRVLDIGAGAGRFTQVLSRLGARVTVADISRVQLQINRTMGQEHDYAEAVEAYHQMDICEMDEYEDDEFDAVVAYGGVFSYVLDRRDDALAECWRVLKPGGVLLASVMSLWGTCHRHLPGVLTIPNEKNQVILSSGDLLPETVGADGNRMHLFRPEELSVWLTHAGWEVMHQSASGVLSLVWGKEMDAIRGDADQWEALLAMELEACKERQALAMGTHLIVQANRPLARDTQVSPMLVEYQDVFFRDGQRMPGESKRIKAPFQRVSARALILRECNGAILGTRHHPGACFALPGGALEDGESSAQAIIRELDEENILLQEVQPDWRSQIDVDYFAGYGELSIWHLFIVKEADVRPSYENVVTRWIRPEENVWYPHLRRRIQTFILRSAPSPVRNFWHNEA